MNRYVCFHHAPKKTSSSSRGIVVLVFSRVYLYIRCALHLLFKNVLSRSILRYFLKNSFLFLCWFAEKSYLCTRKTGTTPTDRRSWFSYAIKERVL